MKKVVLLVMVALLALPALALATDFEPPDQLETCDTATFQAYGEAMSGYSVGCSTVEAGIFSVDTRSKTIDCEAGCPTVKECLNIDSFLGDVSWRRTTDPQCGLDINVKEHSIDVTCGELKQVSAVGSTSGTMLGTGSVCGEPGLLSCNTGFTQTNMAVSSATFNKAVDGTVMSNNRVDPCQAVSGCGFSSTYQNFNVAPAASYGPAAQ